MGRSTSARGLAPLALPLCALLLALSAPVPAAGRLLRGVGAVEGTVVEGAGTPQEPFFLRILKGLMAPQQTLTPQVDAPGDSTRPASSAEGAGIMASGMSKRRDTACKNKVCPDGQHCIPRFRNSWYGSCVCPKGYKKPVPGSSQCVSKTTGEPLTPPKTTETASSQTTTDPNGNPTTTTTTTDPTTTGAGDTGSVDEGALPPSTDAAPPPDNGGNGNGGNGNVQNPCDVSQFTADGCKRAQAVVDLINAFRVTQGLQPDVCLNNKLMASAKKHSEYQEAQGMMMHGEDDPARRNSKMRMNQEGFFALPMAENVADGYGLPKGVVGKWSVHPGHRENLLRNTPFGGVWKAGNFWTLDLGGPSGKEECNPYVQ